ncbi:putative athila retroelement ORF1 protein, partial [Trifolium medium]|nr:putative athila retroelement ORF1 protein [Trifolium medium]
PPPPPRRTLGDYGRGTNGGQEIRGFQRANPVAFDIKNFVPNALKENKFSGADVECPNLHLSHFLDVCDYTDPSGVSEYSKRLRFFIDRESQRLARYLA